MVKMISNPKVRRLTKAEIEAIVHTGLISRVAAKTNKNITTVSRILKGQFKRPNPEIVRELEAELDRLDRGTAA